ncbi:hypothetical protein J6590_029123 [Homalodisca vitripennis]|nr:hypothetical protein J6590_029123 [Homalodisca vitripennis]
MFTPHFAHSALGTPPIFQSPSVVVSSLCPYCFRHFAHFPEPECSVLTLPTLLWGLHPSYRAGALFCPHFPHTALGIPPILQSRSVVLSSLTPYCFGHFAHLPEPERCSVLTSPILLWAFHPSSRARALFCPHFAHTALGTSPIVQSLSVVLSSIFPYCLNTHYPINVMMRLHNTLLDRVDMMSSTLTFFAAAESNSWRLG